MKHCILDDAVVCYGTLRRKDKKQKLAWIQFWCTIAEANDNVQVFQAHICHMNLL